MPAARSVIAVACVSSILCWCCGTVAAQRPDPVKKAAIEAKLAELQGLVARLNKENALPRLVNDVEIYAKGGEWILRHNEFYKPNYADFTLSALTRGCARATELLTGSALWERSPGKSIRAYRSIVDDSLQPYAVTLPTSYGEDAGQTWPLYVVLHGRDKVLTEVSFMNRNDGKPAPVDQDFIQLDVFGRTNNAYRWSGETDVFEAIADVKRRYHIDDRRIVLHGFSMGGAGAWHLGLHHPTIWCSVGPGAGFVDFYEYIKVKDPLPLVQHHGLQIYNPIDYALNAFNVPVCTYGGELDPQLAASTNMVAAAKELDVPLKLLVGPGVEHKFHPDSLKEFLAFHQANHKQGRGPLHESKQIRFVTYTLKYNTCDWLTIDEMLVPYRRTTVEGGKNANTGALKLTTANVAALHFPRSLADNLEIDGTKLALKDAAKGLENVTCDRANGEWRIRSSEKGNSTPALRKQHDLQGPIDDAFSQPFVCVVGTGTPWSKPQQAWAQWTFDRFASEFDKWLRGRVIVVQDGAVTPAMIEEKNLILFGDPGANSILAKVLPGLPLTWTKDSLAVAGNTYDPASHGISLIYPNPLNPSRYVVVNSGHTFHAKDFQNSNAWLFPRLGDLAVQKFEELPAGGYRETTVFADFFDSNWKLPSGLATAPREK